MLSGEYGKNIVVCGEYRTLVLSVASIDILCCLASMEKILLFVVSIELLCCL